MKQLPEFKLILDKLVNELPNDLNYHNIKHTLDGYANKNLRLILKNLLPLFSKQFLQPTFQLENIWLLLFHFGC